MLDTSIILHVFKQNKAIAARLDTFAEIFVCPVVIGELRYGAFLSADITRHSKQIDDFLTGCKIISIDNDTATVYGKLRANLKKQGNPIPENDIWIAACAIRLNLPLFTTDKHFEKLEGLSLL